MRLWFRPGIRVLRIASVPVDFARPKLRYRPDRTRLPEQATQSKPEWVQSAAPRIHDNSVDRLRMVRRRLMAIQSTRIFSIHRIVSGIGISIETLGIGEVITTTIRIGLGESPANRIASGHGILSTIVVADV